MRLIRVTPSQLESIKAYWLEHQSFDSKAQKKRATAQNIQDATECIGDLAIINGEVFTNYGVEQ